MMSESGTTRNHANSVKLGAHCIAFYQEQSADYEGLKKFNVHLILKNALHFHFLDEHGNFDVLMKQYYASNIIKIRPHILYQYLKLEEKTNSLFHELGFNLPSLDTIEEQVASIQWDEMSTISQEPSLCTIDNLFDARHVSDIIDCLPEFQDDAFSAKSPTTTFTYSLVTEDILSAFEDSEDHQLDYESAV